MKPWSNIEIIKEITIHKPWADSFLMGILHYFDIWIFRNFYISSLLEKRIVPSKYWKIKMTWNCGFINFFLRGGGKGVSLFVHSNKFIILRICRFVKFFSINNIVNFILQLTFLSLQDSDLSTVNYLRMGEICNTSLWTGENIQNI